MLLKSLNKQKSLCFWQPMLWKQYVKHKPQLKLQVKRLTLPKILHIHYWLVRIHLLENLDLIFGFGQKVQHIYSNSFVFQLQIE